MSGGTIILNNETRKPVVTVPTVTLFHNASIPSTDGYLCVVINFGVQAKFLGTTLDSTIQNSFWNWSEGFELIRRNGVGANNIVLDNQTITVQKPIHVFPVGSGEAILCADLGGTGSSHNYFTSADGDKFPVYDMATATFAVCPQLRAASAGSAEFKANFGSNLAIPLANKFKIFSQTGKVIYVSQGSTSQLLYLDASHNLCQDSGSDITCSTASLVSSIDAIGEARFLIYVNESNGPNEYFEHDFPFVPHDIQIPFDDVNYSITVKYSTTAALNPAARWSSANSRVEADMVGNANITLKASFVERPFENINGS